MQHYVGSSPDPCYIFRPRCFVSLEMSWSFNHQLEYDMYLTAVKEIYFHMIVMDYDKTAKQLSEKSHISSRINKYMVKIPACHKFRELQSPWMRTEIRPSHTLSYSNCRITITFLQQHIKTLHQIYSRVPRERKYIQTSRKPHFRSLCYMLHWALLDVCVSRLSLLSAMLWTIARG